MNLSENVCFVKEELQSYFSNVTINETLIDHSQGVEIYADFLFGNLEYNFQQICRTFDNSMLQCINDIYLPFRNLNITFSINVFNKDYLGRYTAFCPELIGCITEGNSKMKAFENLCFAIAEVLILNHDYLKINPISSGAADPKVTANFFISTPDSYSYDFSRLLYNQAKYQLIYLSKRHLLLKNENYPKITITLLHSGFQELTRHLLKRTVGLE